MGKNQSIAMDRQHIISSAEEYTVLAEEFAHYETDALYLIEATANTSIGRLNRIACEARAKHDAIKKLLPFDELKEAMHNGISESWEIAEHFDITEGFVREALEYYFERCQMTIT